MIPPRTYVLRELLPIHDVQAWVCPDDGVVVFDRDLHDRWHESLEKPTL